MRTLALKLLNQYEDHISAASLLEQVLHPRHIRGIFPSPLFSGLHCASFFGSAELVTELISAEGDQINQQDCGGSTPLAWAARNGHEGTVNILLRRTNIDPNHPDKDNRTPLVYAAMAGYEGVVKLLLERKDVDPNHPDKDHTGPLGWAASKGHERVVKLLLDRGDVDLNHPDVYGRTPLGDATRKGHEAVVKLLLERENVDPNRPDKNDRTPLVCAAMRGHEGVVKLLLDGGMSTLIAQINTVARLSLTLLVKDMQKSYSYCKPEHLLKL